MGCPEAHAAATTLLAGGQRICSAWQPSHGHLVMFSPSHGLSWGCRAFYKPCCPPDGDIEAEGPRAVLPENLAERAQAGCHLCAAEMASSQRACESISRIKLAHTVAVSSQSEHQVIAAEILTGARRLEGRDVHAFSCALRDDISILHSIAHQGITAFPLVEPTAVKLFGPSSERYHGQNFSATL